VLIMWLFLTRRFRMWVMITVLAPLFTGVLRRLGLALQQRKGPTTLSNGLLRAGDLGERARVKLGGKPRRGR
jgi:formate hydrogenlyase subunit 4